MNLKISYNAPIALTFSIICVIAFIISPGAEGLLKNHIVLSPYLNFSNPSEWPSMIMYIFGHADENHLLGNLSFILLLGPIIEEKYGSLNLLIMIILTALITAVLNIAFFTTGIMGASGIVFLFIILASITNVRQGEIPLSFILVLLLFVGKEVMQSMDSDNISQFGHIIGGICGGVFGFLSMGGQDSQVFEPKKSYADYNNTTTNTSSNYNSNSSSNNNNGGSSSSEPDFWEKYK